MIAPRRLHRAIGALLAVFVAVHVANHLAALAGVDAHVRFMERARLVYRQPVVEGVLLLCVVVQAASGLRMLWAGRQRRRGVLAWLQAGSGAYLAVFLAIHVTAVLAGRAVGGLDTNFYFAAAGLHVWPFVLFFAPYYFLAVAALFVHLGCALRRGGTVVAWSSGAGIVVAALIVAILMGKVVPVEIPVKYLQTFENGEGGHPVPTR
jgi:succinate dehydrogenase/fumarate reductase cytochrome b subunit